MANGQSMDNVYNGVMGKGIGPGAVSNVLKGHCGIPYSIYVDIEKAGEYDVQFSMREDGFEFDKFLLTKDRFYKPEDKGPEVFAICTIPESYPELEAPVLKK